MCISNLKTKTGFNNGLGLKLTVSKKFNPYSFAKAWPRAVETTYNHNNERVVTKNTSVQLQILRLLQKEKMLEVSSLSIIILIYNGSDRLYTLLPSMSALLPTKILFTLSDACCSIFFIQFLISREDN